MLLRKTFRFEASHILPKHPGKCSRLHGHSWVLHVEVEGPVNADTGFVMDYADISAPWKEFVDHALDHRHLGAWDIPWTGADLSPNFWLEKNKEWAIPFEYDTLKYPTSENILFWIGEIFQTFPWSKLALEETCTSYAELTREEFDATHNKS
jgi:queuosine biosynthesis protein QueD